MTLKQRYGCQKIAWDFVIIKLSLDSVNITCNSDTIKGKNISCVCVLTILIFLFSGGWIILNNVALLGYCIDWLISD